MPALAVLAAEAQAAAVTRQQARTCGAVYLGDGQFIHAPHTGSVVRIASLSSRWYRTGYTGAVRIE